MINTHSQCPRRCRYGINSFRRSQNYGVWLLIIEHLGTDFYFIDQGRETPAAFS
jgi:hypothetical protein